MSPAAPHSRPALTADVAAFRVRAMRLELLLVQRGRDPFRGSWALPGGFVEEGETLGEAAARELEEETGLCPASLEQLRAFGDPGRDPRGWTVTVVFLAAATPGLPEPRGGDDADRAAWFPALDPPALAFDHDEILDAALERLEERATDPAFLAPFLPPVFDRGRLREVLAALLGPLARSFEEALVGNRLLVSRGPGRESLALSGPDRRP